MSVRLAALVTAVMVVAACAGDSETSDNEPDGTVSEIEPAATTPAETDASSTEPLEATTTAAPPAETTTTTPPTTSTTARALPEGYAGHVNDVYSDDAHWLCRPGKDDDVCSRNLDATIVRANGSTKAVPHVAATDPVADCFYVYPTVSQDPDANSDLDPGEGEEIATALNQFARLSAECRTFAPVYRQWTLTALSGAVESTDESWEVAYGDALDAFRHFIANDADDRPFVLIGHSQGASILRRLVEEEIDDQPALRTRMLSAMLLGTSVAEDAFVNVPPCETAGSINCVISYSSYRNTSPPPPEGFFGRTEDGPALCVNPVDPAGGAAASTPYFMLEGALLGGAAQPFDDAERTAEISTPFVTFPNMVTVECVKRKGFGYLELRTSTRRGPRIDDVGGDLSSEWGMHLIDANVAMGDLVALVGTQAATWSATDGSEG